MLPPEHIRSLSAQKKFERIPLLQQKVQLGALRAAPGAASLPREGRGEAPVQQHFQ